MMQASVKATMLVNIDSPSMSYRASSKQQKILANLHCLTTSTVQWVGSTFINVLNYILVLNRVGRACATGVLALTFPLGASPPLWVHLLWCHTAAIWANGYNDICDYEMDLKAYGRKGRGLRKILICGAMSKLELRCWLGFSLLGSYYMILHYSHSLEQFLRASLYFSAAISCGIVYNLNSKHMESFTIPKAMGLDLITSWAILFHFFFTCEIGETKPDTEIWRIVVGGYTILGFVGNLLSASKDIATDPISLPILLGATPNKDGCLVHSRTSRLYYGMCFASLAALCAYTSYAGYWIASAPMSIFCLVMGYRILGPTPLNGKQYATAFARVLNCLLFLVLGLYVNIDAKRIPIMIVLSAIHMILSMRFVYRPEGGLFLRLGYKSLNDKLMGEHKSKST